MRSSKFLSRVLTVVVLASTSAWSVAQISYPSKPIRLIVPLAAGAGTDIAARQLAEKMAERWGQPVLVENRTGGNTVLGTDAVAKAPPDGYTILVTTNAHTVIPLMMTAPYNALRDFAPLATIMRGEWVLTTLPSNPANNLSEFIALARSKPDLLTYGSSGAGGASHLATELFASMNGLKMRHIPYKGGTAVIPDLVGGRLDFTFGTVLLMAPLIKSGKLKAIAVSGETRVSVLPDVPTFTESGLSGFDAGFWIGALAPAGTPNDVLEKLSSEIQHILNIPAVRQKFSDIGSPVFMANRREFATLLRNDADKYARVIKAANIKLE